MSGNDVAIGDIDAMMKGEEIRAWSVPILHQGRYAKPVGQGEMVNKAESEKQRRLDAPLRDPSKLVSAGERLTHWLQSGGHNGSQTLSCLA